MCPALTMKFIQAEFRKLHAISDFYSPLILFSYNVFLCPIVSTKKKEKKVSKLEGKF